MTVSASVAYAFTLGLIAAINPCGFPLLPGYLALFARRDIRPDRGRRTRAVLCAGGSMTGGFIVVFATIGLLASSAAQLVIQLAPWFMIVIGVSLAILGIAGLFGRQFRVILPAVRFRSGTGLIAMGGFGVAYAVGSLTCALPLFVAGVAGTFTRLGLFAGLAAFVAYALGMGTFVTGLGLIAAHASGTMMRGLRRASRLIPAVANTLETLVGLYLVFYWVNDLIDPLSATPVIRVVGSIQGAVSGILSNSPLVFGGALGVIVVVGFAVAAWSTRRRPSNEKPRVIDRMENAPDAQ